MAAAHKDESAVVEPQAELLRLLTDGECDDQCVLSHPATKQRYLPCLLVAHCHPTDALTSSSLSPSSLAQQISTQSLRNAVLMSTNARDNPLVRILAAASPAVIPAFGWHPWYSHTISLDDAPTKRAHYERVFELSSADDARREDLEVLLPHLPEPVPLQSVLTQLDKDLTDHPHALVGEVGIDKAFKIPYGAAWRSAERERESGGDDAARGPRLSSLAPSLAHQLAVLDAQYAMAVRHRRALSLHCVRANGALVRWLEDISARDGVDFGGARIDLHSCTLSPEGLKELLRHYPHLWVSISTAINARSKASTLTAQLAHIPRTRLLVESDWHAADELGARVWGAALRVREAWAAAPPCETHWERQRAKAERKARAREERLRGEQAPTDDAAQAPWDMRRVCEQLGRNWDEFHKARQEGEDEGG